MRRESRRWIYDKDLRDDLLASAAIVFEVPVIAIRSHTKKTAACEARRACYNYLKREAGMTLESTGAAMDRNHASVIHGLRKHDELVDTGDAYVASYRRLIETMNTRKEDSTC